jgi:hypothetical protein
MAFLASLAEPVALAAAVALEKGAEYALAHVDEIANRFIAGEEELEAHLHSLMHDTDWQALFKSYVTEDLPDGDEFLQSLIRHREIGTPQYQVAKHLPLATSHIIDMRISDGEPGLVDSYQSEEEYHPFKFGPRYKRIYPSTTCMPADTSRWAQVQYPRTNHTGQDWNSGTDIVRFITEGNESEDYQGRGIVLKRLYGSIQISAGYNGAGANNPGQMLHCAGFMLCKKSSANPDYPSMVNSEPWIELPTAEYNTCTLRQLDKNLETTWEILDEQRVSREYIFAVSPPYTLSNIYFDIPLDLPALTTNLSGSGNPKTISIYPYFGVTDGNSVTIASNPFYYVTGTFIMEYKVL